MTRVDFYVLGENNASSDPLGVVCRLCDKAVGAGQRVFVHAPDAVTADALDGLLWSFRQGSFIAHERVAGDALPDAPLPDVLLGDGAPPAGFEQILVNLAADVPTFFSRFERVLELVYGDGERRNESRARFKFYRDRGYPLDTHELSGAGSR